ncbi:zinc dependent phospholipase C family protein [Pseudoalteromonas sp. ASV78]|uniref:zinc dependent phospholipase C family protein n=1 Tax=Pseudoalteromonas sp. ASV78 TaxID=3397851 RepID=UPI0039FCCBF4
MNLNVIISILIGFLVSQPISAFELKTHLYIAEEVYRDLADDRRLTISPFGSFAVDAKIVDSILSNKAAFLYGNLGPDVVPDFVGGQATAHTSVGNGWVTDDWLKFTQPQEVATSEWYAFHKGYLNHAASDVFAHTYVNTYAGGIFDLSDSSDFSIEMRHKMIEKYISQYQPYSVSQDWSDPLFSNNSSLLKQIENKFIKNHEAANQYELTGISSYLADMRKYRNDVAKMATPLELIKSALKSELQSAYSRKAYYELIADKFEQIHEQQFKEKEKSLLNLSKKFEEVAKLADCAVFFPNDPSAKKAGLCASKKEIEAAILKKAGVDKELEALASGAINFIEGNLEEFYNDHPELKELVNPGSTKSDFQGPLQYYTQNEVVQLLAITTAAIVFGEQINLELLAFNAVTLTFQKESIDKAIEKYVEANALTARDISNGKKLVTSLTHLNKWLSCYGPVFTFEYGGVVPPSCTVAEKTIKLKNELEKKIKQEIINNAGSNTQKFIDFYATIQETKTELNRLATTLGKNIILSILTKEQKDIIKILTSPSSDQGINALFSQSGYEDLLRIPDISTRLKSDMDLRLDNTFNPDTFSPVYNAIKLSKLSLLNESEINRLEVLAGASAITDSLAHYKGQYSIIYSWIASLDGNHQWMPISPKLPRSQGVNYPLSETQRSFSLYGGLGWWNSEAHKNKLFEKLFKGPSNASIESPIYMGLPALLPRESARRNCYSDPFPRHGNEFETCSTIADWLIPVLHILL